MKKNNKSRPHSSPNKNSSARAPGANKNNFKKNSRKAELYKLADQFENEKKYLSTHRYQNLILKKQDLSPRERENILYEIQQFHPIWEMRFSKHNPPPEGTENRQLLRPVYWLGNWQFACLNYYHPPQGIRYRCVEAESFPPHMQALVDRIEALVKTEMHPRDIPQNWTLNTCLINYYGDSIDANGKKTDCARVGEHKDFEPGPVASISFGERALFQFVDSQGKSSQSQVILQQWLEDCDLQIFAGDKFKKNLFHRVQRVESKDKYKFSNFHTENFEVRRINLTFRYVPKDHIYNFTELPEEKQEDIHVYIKQLANYSSYWKHI